ncbi:MAG: glycosyltransferase family 9 protein, partial [Deltaproteobacteria bacterium]
AELAGRLRALGLEKVALVGGPDDVEECEQIAAACSPELLVNLCGQTRILDIVPLCESARVIVSNDTGTAHIASATDTPMLVICGPTDPRRVKPVGPQVAVLQVEGPCINCYRKNCNYSPKHLCMNAISVDMVIEKLRSMPNALPEV